MKENRLIKIILLFLVDGEKPRYKVTYKIKNYPKEIQLEAIKSVIGENLVTIREDERSSRGRTPCFISLTEKGLKKAKGYSSEPDHKSIWNPP